MYLLTPFILQIFKKILEWIQSYEDAPFLGPKGSICPKQTLVWPFLTIFGRFCPLIFFLKNPALSHTTIYEPPTPCQVSEKTTELIPRENTDRRKDGWTDPSLQDPSGRGRESNKKRMCFFQLLYLESGYFIFYLQLTLRQLIQPDLESWFIVRSQLGPIVQSGSFPSAGLQVVTQSTHLSKDCYPQLVSNPHRSEIRPPKQLQCMPLHPAYLKTKSL